MLLALSELRFLKTKPWDKGLRHDPVRCEDVGKEDGVGRACIGCVLGVSRETDKRVSVYPSLHLSLYLSPYRPPIIYPSSLCIYLSIAIVSVLPSVCLSIYLFIYLKRFIVRNWDLLWRLQASPSALQAETPESSWRRSETGKPMRESQSEGETDVPAHTGWECELPLASFKIK